MRSSPFHALRQLAQVYRWAVPAALVLGVLAALAEGLGISLFVPFLEALQGPESAEGEGALAPLRAMFDGIPRERRLMVLAGGIVGLAAAKALFAYANALLTSRLHTQVGHYLRSKIFDRLTTVGYRFIERASGGDLLNTLSTETWRATEAILSAVQVLVLGVTLLVYVALLTLLSLELTLLVAVSMLGIFLLVRVLTRRSRALGRAVSKHNSELSLRMLEGVEGMFVIRTSGREHHERERFNSASQTVTKALFRVEALTGAIGPLYELLAAVLLVCVLLIGLRNGAELSALFVFLFVLYRVQPVVRTIDWHLVRLNTLRPALDEVDALLDPADASSVESGSVRSWRLEDAISFDRVGFQYEPDEPLVLDGVTMTIPAGQMTALVGPSGAGKSTLIKLLLRLYDPVDGAIRVDGQTLHSLDLQSWREGVAVVAQDVYVFNDTVRANIAYGSVDADEADVIAAATEADAMSFINELPDGLDTVIGDRGVRLSGGQRQRLSLARAVVRRPQLLILDEATNALDNLSEQTVRAFLESRRGALTTVVIAHRLSTIKHADRIVVFDRGRIEEIGSYNELLAAGGLFSRLHAAEDGAPTPVEQAST